MSDGYVVAELDYLVATRQGVEAELTVLEELAGGAWMLARFETADLADASLVVLAERMNTRRILTLDHRHLAVVRPQQGGRLSLLPGS